MQYISTEGHTCSDLREAVVNCYAPDGGLYLPEKMPVLPAAYFNNLEEMSLAETAYVVANTLLSDQAPSAVIKAAVDEAFNFSIPLLSLSAEDRFLELYNGPTRTFKDVSTRFMASFLRRIRAGKPLKACVLTATTGNTGAAISAAFAGMDGIEVFVLYPAGAYRDGTSPVSDVASENVHLYEVAGTISDCKRMVRQAVGDSELQSRSLIVSANSHNIIRILPQITYFFHAYGRLRATGARSGKIDFAIPCGNLSNLVTAVLAKRMGLPVGKIVAACTANDALHRVLGGELDVADMPRVSKPTFARAMDSGFPTNMQRLLALYGGDIAAIRRDIVSATASDEDIAEAIRSVYHRHGYVIDPHTAVAYHAKEQLMADDRDMVVLATAHPQNSAGLISGITGLEVKKKKSGSKVRATKLAPSLAALKKNIKELV